MKMFIVTMVAACVGVAGAADRMTVPTAVGVAREDTAAIQRTIDAVSKNGGGVVVVPKGTYRIGSIYLKDNVELNLSEGAKLLASDNPGDYNRANVCPQNWSSVKECSSGAHLILAIGKKNVAITGKGEINGNSAAFLLGRDGKIWPVKWPVSVGIPWRPGQMVYFVECDGVKLRDVELANSPYWSCFIHGCDNVDIEGLRVHTVRRPFHTQNGDGIDLDSSRNIVLRNCDINTADDSITLRCSTARLTNKKNCENVRIENCRLASSCNAIRFGVGDGMVTNVLIRNLTIRDTRTAFNFVSSWGKTRGVDFRDITIENADVEAKMLCRLYRRFGSRTDFDGITFRDMKGKVESPSWITADPKFPMGRIVFENVNLDKGVTAVNVNDLVIRGGTLKRNEVTAADEAKYDKMLSEGKELGGSPTLIPQRIREVKMLPGEKWWGGANYYGDKMPFGETTTLTVDLTKTGWSNQYASLMISDKGREIWSDDQCTFTISNGVIRVESEGMAEVEVVQAGGNLRDALMYASKHHFPPSGKLPDEMFITAPQYNTWCELTYNQNERDILAYAQSMLDNGLPPGVFMIDSTWQVGYGDWRFEPTRFKDPKGMVDKLHAMGFKVILWMCPWVGMDLPAYRYITTGIDPMKEGKAPTGGFMMYNGMEKRNLPAAVQWWDGQSALLDFTHPNARRWFKGVLDGLVREYGVDGFKLDGGSLHYYTQGFRVYEPMCGGDQANLYAAYTLMYPTTEYRHTWKMGGQPIVVRLHDKGHSWKDLQTLVPHMMSSGLLGHMFVCPDMIGGGEWHSFLPGAPFEPELFVRSAQVHALCGMMQFSSSPWRMLKDKTHQQIIRDTVATRQKFAPKFLELAKTVSKTGEPMIRNLEYMYPGRGYGEIRDQFMMGDFLLVAPVVEKGATKRSVVLPPGKWLADDGREYVGDRTIEVDAPLSRLPYFVKAE